MRLNATGVLSLLMVGLGTALLLPPGRVSAELPGEEDIGSLATSSVKANRDYTIPDPETTRALRTEAARNVRPVYDFDVSLGEQAALRIQRAFAFARARLQAEQESVREKHQRNASKKELQAPDLVQLAEPLYAEFLKTLQAVVEESEFHALARTGFAPEVEKAAVLLVRNLMAEEVAESRELLLAERTNGLTLRTVGGPARTERETRDVERITDLAAVQLDLRRLSQGQPEAPGSRTGIARIALALPAELTPETRRVAALLASRVVRQNLAYNETETKARRAAAAEAVKPVDVKYARGEKIIGDGERIEGRHLLVFRSISEQARMLDTVQVRLGAGLFAVLLSFSVFRLARRTVRRFRPTKRDLVFLTAVLLGNLALLRATLALSELLRDRYPQLTSEALLLLLPTAAGTMLVRQLRSGESSVVFALVYAPLVALQLNSYEPALVALVASIVAADQLGRHESRRGALVIAGLVSSLSSALAVAALALFGGHLMLPTTGMDVAAAAFGAGVLSPLIAALVAPLFELVFGYTTEIRLRQLANLNHPVLKELIIRAPGTYHHSLLVGDLAAAAAERIGANALLARVGGYFHDLGKAEAPLMFAENQRGENRLEKLPPEEAAAVLRRHISAGLEAASRARLPRAVLDCIAQHHGRSLAGPFHALASTDTDGVDDELFRYQGPRPRSREIALVMLSDAVESASRRLADATPERLRQLVPQVVEQILLSGELDESDLSLSELRVVTESLADTLIRVHFVARADVPPLRVVPAPSPIASEPQAP